MMQMVQLQWWALDNCAIIAVERSSSLTLSSLSLTQVIHWWSLQLACSSRPGYNAKCLTQLRRKWEKFKIIGLWMSCRKGMLLSSVFFSLQRNIYIKWIERGRLHSYPLYIACGMSAVYPFLSSTSELLTKMYFYIIMFFSQIKFKQIFQCECCWWRGVDCTYNHLILRLA